MVFIHCADLHLDSPMETSLSPEQARERNIEICKTFASMAAFAKKQGAQAVLIAGDFFDSRRVTRRTADFVLNVIAQSQPMDFLYLSGNHDESRRAFAGRVLPSNLKTFSSDHWQDYRYGSVRISGIESSEEFLYDTLDLNEEDTNIVMLHGQVSGQTGPGLVCLPRLKGKHIHYLALGHLHTFHQERLDDEGFYCYSGCLEGRGFDECGEKGFVYLDCRGHDFLIQFVAYARRNLVEVPVNISGLDSAVQLLRAIEEAGKQIPKHYMVRFVLQGSCSPDTNKDLAFLYSHLKDQFYCVRIRDESRLHVPPERYEHDISLRGEFTRRVLELGRSPEETDLILRWGLQALNGEEITL